MGSDKSGERKSENNNICDYSWQFIDIARKKNLKEFMMPESLETLIGFFWTLEFFSLDSSIAIVEIRHKLI